MRDTDLSWRDVLAILRRRRQLIWTVCGAGAALMLAASFLLGPTYRASATLMVTATRTRAISPDAEAMPLVDRVTEEDLNSQAELLRSETLIRRVLAPQAAAGLMPQPGLAGRLLGLPREAGRWLYRTVHGVAPRSELDEWTDDVADHLNVSLVKKTNLIEVRYRQRDVDPEWAAWFVNSLVDAGLRQRSLAGQQQEATAFFEDQRVVLGERLRAVETAKHAFFAREGLDSIPEQRVLLRNRLAELGMVLQDVDTELAAAGARVAGLQREIGGHSVTQSTEVRRAQNQAVAFLKPRILDKEMERNALLSKYAPGNSRVTDVERELAEARRLLNAEQATVAETTTALNPTYQALEQSLAQARVEQAALTGRAAALRARLDETRATIAHLDDVAAEHHRLEQDVAAANEAFATYTRKQEQARLGSALDASRMVNVAVLEPAEAPPSPERAHGLLLFALGMLFWLAVGIGAACLADLLDPSVRSARDAELISGLPVLAEIPS